MANSEKLAREFYTRQDTLLIARQLLGKRLVVPATDGTRVSGMIVETEAYMGPEDKASHAYGNRRTKRTEAMFSIGGIAYVYLVYGMHYQFNVVTNIESMPHAVLIRAIEPDEGLASMRQRRLLSDDRNLTNGPGKLCQALGIDRSYNEANLLGERVWIEENNKKITASQIASGVRIGINYAEEYINNEWRFWLKGNPWVSR